MAQLLLLLADQAVAAQLLLNVLVLGVALLRALARQLAKTMASPSRETAR